MSTKIKDTGGWGKIADDGWVWFIVVIGAWLGVMVCFWALVYTTAGRF